MRSSKMFKEHSHKMNFDTLLKRKKKLDRRNETTLHKNLNITLQMHINFTCKINLHIILVENKTGPGTHTYYNVGPT